MPHTPHAEVSAAHALTEEGGGWGPAEKMGAQSPRVPLSHFVPACPTLLFMPPLVAPSTCSAAACTPAVNLQGTHLHAPRIHKPQNTQKTQKPNSYLITTFYCSPPLERWRGEALDPLLLGEWAAA
jgi:hypothetical protein